MRAKQWRILGLAGAVVACLTGCEMSALGPTGGGNAVRELEVQVVRQPSPERTVAEAGQVRLIVTENYDEALEWIDASRELIQSTILPSFYATNEG